MRNCDNHYKYKLTVLRITQRGVCVEQSVIPIIIFQYRIKSVHQDKVVVLSDGTVAEQGKPGELLAQDGIFSRMVKLQTESRVIELTIQPLPGIS